jgi:hypothetical protein
LRSRGSSDERVAVLVTGPRMDAVDMVTVLRDVLRECEAASAIADNGTTAP